MVSRTGLPSYASFILERRGIRAKLSVHGAVRRSPTRMVREVLSQSLCLPMGGKGGRWARQRAQLEQGLVAELWGLWGLFCIIWK